MYPAPNPQEFLSAYNPYYYQAKLFQKSLDLPVAFPQISKKDDVFSAETDLTDSLSPHSAGSQLFTKKEDFLPKIEPSMMAKRVKEEEMRSVKLELAAEGLIAGRRAPILGKKKPAGGPKSHEESPLEKEVKSQLGGRSVSSQNDEEILINGERSKENKISLKKKGLLQESKKISKMAKDSPDSKESSPNKKEKSRNKRRLWTSDEDQRLLILIEQVGFRWTRIGRMIGGRSGNQVRDRYINNLRPGLSNLPWSEEEDQLLKTLYYILGSRWCCVVRYLPGRSEAQAKNRFYNEVKMQLKPEEEKTKIMKLIIDWKKSLKNQRHPCKQEEDSEGEKDGFNEILERIYLNNENVYFHSAISFDNIPAHFDSTWDMNEGVFMPKTN